jgi:hypothetical protein
MAHGLESQKFAEELPVAASGLSQRLAALSRQQCICRATSPPLSTKAVMQNEKFFHAVALAFQAGIKAASDFSLPRGIVGSGALANVISQFQPLLNRQFVHSTFEFNNAHASNMVAWREFLKPNFAPVRFFFAWSNACFTL